MLGRKVAQGPVERPEIGGVREAVLAMVPVVGGLVEETAGQAAHSESCVHGELSLGVFWWYRSVVDTGRDAVISGDRPPSPGEPPYGRRRDNTCQRAVRIVCSGGKGWLCAAGS